MRFNMQGPMLVAITLLVGLAAVGYTSTAQNTAQSTQNTQQLRATTSNATSNLIVPPAMSSANWAIARRASFAANRGVEKGDWKPIVDMMDENVTVLFAIPGRWRGIQYGKAQVAEYYRWRWEDLNARTKITSYSVATNGNTAAFENYLEATVLGGKFKVGHHFVKVFEVRDGKISHWHDYDQENDEPEKSLKARGLGGVYGERHKDAVLRLPPKPQPVLTTVPPPMSAENFAVAQHAFDTYKRSMETGDGQPFMDMIADNVTFFVGYPGRWVGVKSGKAQVAELIRWHRNNLQLRARVLPEPVVTNPTTAGWEFYVQGTAQGQEFTEPFHIFFDVRDGKISGFRQYFGVRRNTAQSIKGTPVEEVLLGPPGSEIRKRAEAVAR